MRIALALMLGLMLGLTLPAFAERPAYQQDSIRQATLVLANKSWAPLRVGLLRKGVLFIGAGPIRIPPGQQVYLALPPGPYRIHTPTGPNRVRWRIRPEGQGKTLLHYASRREFALAEGVALLLAESELNLAKCAHLDRRRIRDCAKKLYFLRHDGLEIFEGTSRSLYPIGGSALARAASRAVPYGPQLLVVPQTTVIVHTPPVSVHNHIRGPEFHSSHHQPSHHQPSHHQPAQHQPHHRPHAGAARPHHRSAHGGYRGLFLAIRASRRLRR